MPKDNAIEFKKPGSFVDNPITDVLRTGAIKFLVKATLVYQSGLFAKNA